ncbi:MAG TPA: LysM peptidoglycan-binding domain-containing protein [Anaerolineae bacterium]
MKNRVRPILLFSLLIVLALALAACEKDRPAPKTAATSSPSGTRAAGTAAPGAVRGGTVAAASAATSGTPMPPTPIPLQPAQGGAPASAGTAQTGAQTSAGAGSGQSWVYTVQAGDTLAQITSKLGVARDAILGLNPGINPDVLSVGQQIKIPGEVPAGYGGYGRYTVQAGDTLNSIAQQFGMTLQDLQAANNIADATALQIGQVLKVKGTAPATGGQTAGTQPAATDSGTAGSTAGGSGQTTTYIVQRGDMLSRIAARYGVTVQYLVNLNGLANADAIYTGQKLIVPATAPQGAAGGTQSGRQYTVQRGDTLTTIAARFGVTRQALMNANGITNPDLIRTGQVLQIP